MVWLLDKGTSLFMTVSVNADIIFFCPKIVLISSIFKMENLKQLQNLKWW
jgi:hypothetical protein